MIITITVSGGWAGLRSTCVVDTHDLIDREARRIEIAVLKCVEGARPPERPRSRDARTFRLEAELIDGARFVSFSEAAAPPEALAVLTALRPICPQLL